MACGGADQCARQKGLIRVSSHGAQALRGGGAYLGVLAPRRKSRAARARK